MILHNPFFLILIVLMAITLIHANSMDGAQMPRRKYSFTQTLIGVIFNFLLIYFAIVYAIAHS